MAGSVHYFWSAWPPASQQRFFKLMLYGVGMLCFMVFVGLYMVTGTLDQQIGEAKEQYGQVLPLVQDVKSLRAQQGDLAHLPVEKAAWRIIEDLLIEENLVSFHRTSLNEDDIGVQATFEGLSLTKLTDFLRDLRDRASLQTPDCTVTRNPDDPRLADVHLVLAR